MSWPTCTRCGHPGKPFYLGLVLCDFHSVAEMWGEAWAHARARLLAFCGRWDIPGNIPEAQGWDAR